MLCPLIMFLTLYHTIPTFDVTEKDTFWHDVFFTFHDKLQFFTPICFYAPLSKDRGAYCFTVFRLSVCLSICLSAQTSRENLTFSYYSEINLLTRLIFGMKAYLINMHLLVSRSRSSAKVKVKYKGYISQKRTISGALVFHTHTHLVLPENPFNLELSVILLFGKKLIWTRCSEMSMT